MRKLLRPFVLGTLTATALISVAAPAGAQAAADFQDARVEVAPGCAGTVRTQVSVTPLPTDVVGVGISVLFRADRPDPACTLPATVTWHNVATGAFGSQEVSVPSVPTADGWFPTDHGFERALADTGPGPVVITMSTNPGQVSVTV